MKDNIKFIFQLNNKNRSTNYFILFIVSGLLFLGAAFYFVATNLNILLIIDVIIAIAYFIIFSIIKPSFFEMLVTNQQIQVNYYAVSSVARSYHSIELSLNQLKDYSIKKKSGGLKKILVLSVESKYGIADYPPVSISILTKKEIAQIVFVLNEILKTNQQK